MNKLYTRSKKRGSIKSVLETLVYHGAREEILVELPWDKNFYNLGKFINPNYLNEFEVELVFEINHSTFIVSTHYFISNCRASNIFNTQVDTS